jgi:NAD(P)-dependent dehydrogenase (short-subunit alcohol dehydrogenase family)
MPDMTGGVVVRTSIPLSGLVAVVTGCARPSGIGRAVALALAGAGADVVVTGRGAGDTPGPSVPQRDALDSLVDEARGLGGRAIAVRGDVADLSDAERMVAEAISTLGQVDILVNNAAAPLGPDRAMSWLVPADAYDAVMRTNARGVFIMSGVVIRHLLARGTQGRIVNIASVAGKVGYPMRSAYCASKFAVVGLTQAMAQELAPHGVTVNVVCPGAIATDRNAATRRNAQATLDPSAAAASSSPVGRIGEPGDVARAVLYLADPAADYVTGQSVIVDGGLYMY